MGVAGHPHAGQLQRRCKGWEADTAGPGQVPLVTPVLTGEAQLWSGNWVRRRTRPSTGASGESRHRERSGCCGRRPRHGLTWDYVSFLTWKPAGSPTGEPSSFSCCANMTTSVPTMLASVTRPRSFFQGLGSVPIGVCAGCGCSVVRGSEVPGRAALLLPFCTCSSVGPSASPRARQWHRDWPEKPSMVPLWSCGDSCWACRGQKGEGSVD